MKRVLIWCVHLILIVVTAGAWLAVLAVYYLFRKSDSDSSPKWTTTSPNKLYKKATGKDL